MEQTPFDISSELNEKIQRLMGYLSKAKDNGELQIFSSLFTLDYEIIGYLYHHPNAHPSEMADFLKVTRPQHRCQSPRAGIQGFLGASHR
jgi:hypothetical protein